MPDRLREAGIVVAHLSRALLDGSRDLSTVPGLVLRIIDEKMWQEWADPKSGRMFGPFESFESFVITPASQGGLGATVNQLIGLCDDDIKARDAVIDAAHYNVMGNSESEALRRLRKDRPDLHARVLAGELSAHAAMVEAGFRHRTVTVPIDDLGLLAGVLRRRLTKNERDELRDLL